MRARVAADGRSFNRLRREPIALVENERPIPRHRRECFAGVPWGQAPGTAAGGQARLGLELWGRGGRLERGRWDRHV